MNTTWIAAEDFWRVEGEDPDHMEKIVPMKQNAQTN